jgi:two-component system chemotaxis response regulator CheB
MISVLVADDSALVRRLVTGVLNDTPDIRVVGTAVNGQQAIEKADELRPDLVTLDIEMPVMDGLTALKEIRRRFPRLPVIMFSTLTEKGAAVTLDALASGASDYVTKPTGAANLTQSLDEVGSQLIPRVRALTARAKLRSSAVARPQPAAPAAARPRTAPVGPLQVVAIGSSTGGPDALSRVLGAITTRPRVPIVIVQHMPPVFTGMLAQRLDRIGPATVVEAHDNQPLEPGVVYIAPGGRHLEVQRRGVQVLTRLQDQPPVNFSRPSVDVLFRSVAATYPGSSLGIVLTGMGHDGREGSRAIGATGSTIVAQDEPTSVVWGMPGAVTEAGLADAVLPLDDVGRYLAAELERTGSGALVLGARRT